MSHMARSQDPMRADAAPAPIWVYPGGALFHIQATSQVLDDCRL